MKQKVIFLDRDGVINRYPGDKEYVTAWGGFRFLPGAKEAIAALYQNGFKIFVVSNQAGVGKGIFTQESLDNITEKMLDKIKKAGGVIEGVYYCTHRPEESCYCRKPSIGLIEMAYKKCKVDRKKAFFIGDTIRDIITAKSAGCRSVLVLSGKERLSNQKNWEIQPDFIFRNLWEATRFILQNK